jgi:hypothetical protein
MTNDKTHLILARLELGFRTDAAHLNKLEKDLTVTLQSARHFGKQHGAPDDWNTRWHQQWECVEGILRRIRVLVIEMSSSIASNDSARCKTALEAWETIQVEDAKLAEALSALRAQALGLNAAVRREWNLLAGTLESHFETIHSCAEALRIKLELLTRHSREEVDKLVQEILAKLPNRPFADGMETGAYEPEYRKAAIELEQERHKFMGFMDVVRGLIMRVETTEARVRSNRSLRVEEA